MKRKINAFIRRNYYKILLMIDILFMVLGILYGLMLFKIINDFKTLRSTVKTINFMRVKSIKGMDIRQDKKTPVETQNNSILLSGLASYYSWNGCIGCNQNRIMSNGEQLDDMKYTIALPISYFNLYKNKFVTVKNVKTGLSVKAKVTDTGGFVALGRIADLSLATKNIINCSDLCQVEIYANK